MPRGFGNQVKTMQILKAISFLILTIAITSFITIIVIKFLTYGDDARCFSESCRSY